MSVLKDFRLETYFSTWEFKAQHHLAASDAQSMTLEELLGMADPEEAEAFHRVWLGYTETFGSPDLRNVIASTYEVQSPDNILCFAGAEEGIYVACHALLDPGDHAIVLTPNYQSTETIPLSICEVTGVPLNAPDSWSLEVDHVARAIRPSTKVVCINFPHNPTGKIISPSCLHALIELCRQHGLWLFSDEVYHGLGLFPDRQLSQVADVYERGLSLNVVSKAYGLAGLRIGWIACQNDELLVRMERMKHYLSICNSAPSEYLAAIALRNRGSILARNNELLSENFVQLEGFFNDFNRLFDWYRPDGGCIAYPRYIGPGSVVELAKTLVEDVGVLLLPANIYQSDLSATPDDRFRIGFGRKSFKSGLDAFRSFLESRYT